MSRSAHILQSDLAEWGPSARGASRPVDFMWLAVVLGGPGLVIALILGLTVGWAVAAAGAILYAVGVFAWTALQRRMALRDAGARPLDPADAPRLSNIARGLAEDLGVPAPRLWVIPEGGPNALALKTAAPLIAVSQELLDGYTRTELEGVVAHCLIRLQPGAQRRASLAAAFGEAAGPAGTIGLDEVDARAAALTRYPLGLAGALAKASPRAGRAASFWFVPDGSRHLDRDDRAALAKEL